MTTATTSAQSVPTEGVQGDISAYARQGFGTPLPLKAPFGLLIIDFVNGFADPAVFGGGNIPEAIAQTQQLLAHARARGWPVASSTYTVPRARVPRWRLRPAALRSPLPPGATRWRRWRRAQRAPARREAAHNL
jgi:hypothetical protein